MTNQKITPDKIAKIIKEYKNGKSITQIAKENNVKYNSIYYHISKTNYTEPKNEPKNKPKNKLKNELKIYPLNIKRNEINIDKNMSKITNAFFLNLFLNIEKPTRIINNKTKGAKRIKEIKKKWYNDVLKWVDNENFWFDMYEEYIQYNGSNLKKIIRDKINEKIKKI